MYLMLVDGWYSYYDVKEFLQTIPGGVFGRLGLMILLVELSLLSIDLLHWVMQWFLSGFPMLVVVVVVQSVVNFGLCDIVSNIYDELYLSVSDVYWRVMFTNSLLVSIASLMYIILRYIGKLRIEQRKLIIDNLSTQTDNHFIFNCFGTLKELVDTNSEDTGVFLENFSDMYRFILTIGKQTYVTVTEELKFVENYIYLIHVRFPYIVVDIENKSIKNNYTYILPMALQMLVRNAVMHNGNGLGENRLRITISINDKEITVSNNRIPLVSPIYSTGIGLVNIKERYKLYAHKDIVIKESPTNFSVTIPVLYMEDLNDESIGN